VKLAPSILSADFTRLGEQVRRAEAAGADYIHVDVMDGRFVPNLTIGPFVVEAVRRVTTLPLDVHLMIEEPERYLGEFASAGASVLTVHQEACRHLYSTLVEIRKLGMRAGVSLCPATPIQTLEEIVDYVDLLLIMSVEPGFGGQRFIPSSLTKVRRARALLGEARSPAELEVDGGVDVETGPALIAAGADVLVAGSAVFRGDQIEENLQRLRESVAAIGTV
jgi:ribulose-phosphate 3-epimerase